MTLATALHDVGYRTFLAGKYFNVYQLIAPSVPPGWDGFHGYPGGYYNYRIWNNGNSPGEYHGTSAEGLLDRRDRRQGGGGASQDATGPTGLRLDCTLRFARPEHPGPALPERSAMRRGTGLGSSELQREGRLGQAPVRPADAAPQAAGLRHHHDLPHPARGRRPGRERPRRAGEAGSPRQHALRAHNRQRHECRRASAAQQGHALRHGTAVLRFVAGSARQRPENDQRAAHEHRPGAHGLRAGRLHAGALPQRPGDARRAQLRIDPAGQRHDARAATP